MEQLKHRVNEFLARPGAEGVYCEAGVCMSSASCGRSSLNSATKALKRRC
jgi:hypothetical protein